MRLELFISLALMAVASPACAASDKEEAYALSARCGADAREAFRKDFGNGITNTDDGQSMSGIEQSHYSARYNTCFVLIRTTTFNRKERDISTLIELWDLNENKQDGSFFQHGDAIICTVGSSVCRSEAEWQALIEPYISDDSP